MAIQNERRALARLEGDGRQADRRSEGQQHDAERDRQHGAGKDRRPVDVAGRRDDLGARMSQDVRHGSGEADERQDREDDDDEADKVDDAVHERVSLCDAVARGLPAAFRQAPPDRLRRDNAARAKLFPAQGRAASRRPRSSGGNTGAASAAARARSASARAASASESAARRSASGPARSERRVELRGLGEPRRRRVGRRFGRRAGGARRQRAAGGGEDDGEGREKPSQHCALSGQTPGQTVSIRPAGVPQARSGRKGE